MKRFISKYRHGLVIAVYSIIYILLFSYLEHRPVHSYHIVHTVFDDWIPFCEFFIVPYMLWFPYMILAVIYFIQMLSTYVQQNFQETISSQI